MITTLTVNPAIDLTLEVSSLLVEDVNRVKSYYEEIGGKGINVSRVLRELGNGGLETIAVLGGKRGEKFGQMARLRNLRILPVPIIRETRINITVYDQASRRTTKLNQQGPEITARETRQLWETCLKSASRSRYFVMAGSLLPGMKSDWYAKLLQAVKQKGLAAVIDADGNVLKETLAAKPFLIKPNRFEAERVLGRKMTSEKALWQAAEKLKALGAQNVIISLGGEGVLFDGDQGKYRGYSIPVKTRSTIGAGDSFLAGFVHEMARGGSVKEALRLGIACGTHTAMTGVNELCRKSRILKLLPKIKVSRVG